jgi:hypothetical protein
MFLCWYLLYWINERLFACPLSSDVNVNWLMQLLSLSSYTVDSNCMSQLTLTSEESGHANKRSLIQYKRYQQRNITNDIQHKQYINLKQETSWRRRCKNYSLKYYSKDKKQRKTFCEDEVIQQISRKETKEFNSIHYTTSLTSIRPSGLNHRLWRPEILQILKMFNRIWRKSNNEWKEITFYR